MTAIGHNSQAIDADAMRREWEELGAEWADKNAAAELLEKEEKSILAEITADYRQSSKSHTEAETLARASRKFRDYLATMIEGRRLANRARVKLDAFRAEMEWRRTNAATDRALMQLR